MSIRVRVQEALDWDGNETTVLGLSGVSEEVASTRGLMVWLAASGHIVRPFPNGIGAKDGISDRYLEVKPRFTDDDVTSLGGACLDGMFEDAESAVVLYDNRLTAPGVDDLGAIVAATAPNQERAAQQALAA